MKEGCKGNFVDKIMSEPKQKEPTLNTTKDREEDIDKNKRHSTGKCRCSTQR